MRKGIATETIFYIVIGIVVVGLLVTVAISYTGTARSSSDCKVAEQRFCEYWEINKNDPSKVTTGEKGELEKKWTDVKGKCEGDFNGATAGTYPSSGRCKVIGYDI